MLNAFRPKTSCELEARFIQERILYTEKHLAELCNVFAQYSRKVARVRDKGDEIAKVALNYAEAETINRSLAVGMGNFADSVTTLSDYGDIRTQLIDNKVVNELSRYESICKHVKEEVKDIYSAREREINRKRQLDRLRERNPRSRQQIIQAETEFVKATTEVSKIVRGIEEKTTTFERQKLHDIKAILMDFINVELGYHAKALELLTTAYKEVSSIDEDADLQDFQNKQGQLEAEFKKSLHLSEPPNPKGKSALSRSAHSLGSLGAIFSGGRKSPGIPINDEGYSKSEETLDSMKHSISDTEETDSEDEEDSDEITSEKSEGVDKTPPPVLVRKFVKQ